MCLRSRKLARGARGNDDDRSRGRPERFNALARVSEFDNAAWTKAKASVAADAATDPTGASKADSLIEDNTSGVHSVAQGVIGSTAGVGTLTVSVMAKAGSRSFIFIYDSGSNVANFNVATGAAGTIVGGGSTTIAAVGSSGYYRCSFTFPVGATTIVVGLASADNVTSYAGDGTGNAYLYEISLPLGASQIRRRARYLAAKHGV